MFLQVTEEKSVKAAAESHEAKDETEEGKTLSL